jgi:hypothetical protein
MFIGQNVYLFCASEGQQQFVTFAQTVGWSALTGSFRKGGRAQMFSLQSHNSKD